MRLYLLFILFFSGAIGSTQSILPFRNQGKWGLMTPEKKVIFKPSYEFIFNFKDLVFAKFMDGGKYGVIDNSGEQIIPAENNQIKILNKSFFCFKKEAGFGLKNQSGEIVIQPIFREMVSLREDLLLAENDSCKLLFHTENFNEVWVKDLVIYPAKNILILTSDDSCVVYDRNLNLIFQSDHRQFYPEENGVSFSSNSGEYFLNENFIGRFTSTQKPIFQIQFSEHRFGVKEGGFYGIYDPIERKYHLDPEFDWFEELDGSFYKVKKGDRYGLIDKEASWLLPLNYTDIFLLGDGFFVQGPDYKVGICDRNGRLIIPMKYDWVSEHVDHYQVAKGDQIGIYSKSGQLIEYPAYDEIRSVDGSFKCYSGPIKNEKGKVIKYKKVVSFDFTGEQVAGRIEFQNVGIININSVNQNIRFTRDRLNIGVDSIYRWKRMEKKYTIKGDEITAKIWGFRDTSFSRFIVRPKYDKIDVFESRNYTIARKFNYNAFHTIFSPIDALQHRGEHHLIDHDNVNRYPKQGGFMSLSALYKNNEILEIYTGENFVFRSIDSARSWQYTYVDKVNSDQTRRVALSGKYVWCSERDLLKLMGAREFISQINANYNDSVPNLMKNRLRFSAEFVDAPFKIENGQWALINEDHQKLTAHNFDFIDNPVRGKYLSIYKGRWGMISQDSTCIPHIYSELYRMRSDSDHVMLSTNKKFEQFLVDSLGNRVELPIGVKLLNKEGKALLFLENGKYGLLDRELKTLVEPKYGRLKHINYGWYRFRKKGKMGLLRTDGTTIPPQYKELKPLNDQYLLFYDRRAKGLLNQKGDTIISAEYDEIRIENNVLFGSKDGDSWLLFPGGKHKRVVGELKGRLGDKLILETFSGVIIIDQNGKKLNKYSKAKFIKSNGNFLHLEKEGRNVVYDKDALIVYEDIEAIVLLRGEYYYQNKEKEKVIRKFGQKRMIDAGSILKVNEYDHMIVYKANGRYRILNSETDQLHIFPEEVAKILSFHRDHFRVLNKDRSQAYFDLKAKNMYHRKFDLTQPFQDGYAIVEENGEVKVFYQNGSMIEGLVYHKMLPLIGGYFNAQILKSYGLVDENEGELIKPEYDKIHFSSGNLVQLIKDGDVYYYDFEQQKIIK